MCLRSTYCCFCTLKTIKDKTVGNFDDTVTVEQKLIPFHRALTAIYEIFFQKDVFSFCYKDLVHPE